MTRETVKSHGGCKPFPALQAISNPRRPPPNARASTSPRWPPCTMLCFWEPAGQGRITLAWTCHPVLVNRTWEEGCKGKFSHYWKTRHHFTTYHPEGNTANGCFRQRKYETYQIPEHWGTVALLGQLAWGHPVYQIYVSETPWCVRRQTLLLRLLWGKPSVTCCHGHSDIEGVF